MNAENFAEYLKHPSKLYQLNYQELKSLVLQYPYCQNLQWLLLQKSKLDGNKDADMLLERTATGSIDRALLYKKIKSIASIRNPIAADLLLTDDVLELPDLSNFRRPEPILIETTVSETLEESIFTPIEKVIPSSFEEEELDMSRLQVPPRPTDIPEITPDPGIIEPLPTPEIPTQDDPTPTIPGQNPEVPNPQDPEPVLPNEPRSDETSDNQPSNAFEWDVNPVISRESEAQPEIKAPPALASHARQYQPPKLSFVKPATTTATLKKEKQIEAIVAQSIVEKEEVVSETLALILARQGHREKAMRMYEQLILKIPEKSAYFAAQIQKLKQA